MKFKNLLNVIYHLYIADYIKNNKQIDTNIFNNNILDLPFLNNNICDIRIFFYFNFKEILEKDEQFNNENIHIFNKKILNLKKI